MNEKVILWHLISDRYYHEVTVPACTIVVLDQMTDQVNAKVFNGATDKNTYKKWWRIPMPGQKQDDLSSFDEDALEIVGDPRL